MPSEKKTGDLNSIVAEQTPSEKMHSRLKQLVRRAIWPFYARYPNIIPNPYGWNADHYRTKDADDNAKSSLEENVRLKLGCMVVSEIFGPNEVDALYKGLEQMGWDWNRLAVRDQSNVDWIKEQRLYGSEGTLSIGWVSRPEDKERTVSDYRAQFPEDFSGLLVTIVQLTPSVTCLSIGFNLTDNASLKYAEEIDRPAKTTVVPRKRKRSISIHSASHMKEQRVRRVRDLYRSIAIAWVSQNFPGYFSRNCDRSLVPTAEFLSLERFTPFDKVDRKNWQHWTRYLHLDQGFDSWVCTSSPSLRFSMRADDRGRTPNHTVVAVRWDTLNEEDKRFFGRDDLLQTRTYFVHEHIYGILARKVLVDYLRELLRSVKETRHSLTPYRGDKRPVKVVEEINAFFQRSMGVPSIAREVLELSSNDASFEWNASGFRQNYEADRRRVYDIKEALQRMLNRLSLQLIDEDKETREYLNQLASAIGTKESIAAQRRMEFLTFAALAVAIISLIVAWGLGQPDLHARDISEPTYEAG